MSNRQTFFVFGFTEAKREIKDACNETVFEGGKGVKGMNEDTVTILQEINSGCKTATDSIEQVMPSVVDDDLKEIISFYKEKHVRIGESAAVLLNKAEKSEKDPGWMSKVMTWMGTEMRLMMGEENSQIAKVMMDGCNMGVQKLVEAKNDCTDASPESIRLLEELIKTEEEFAEKMKPYL